MSQNQILAVMDYPEGQRFIASAGARGTNSVSFLPVESYLLDMDEKLFPKALEPMDPMACPPEMTEKLISSSCQAGEHTGGVLVPE